MPDRFRPFATARRARSLNRPRSLAGFCGVNWRDPKSGPAIWRAPAPWPGRSGDADELKLDMQRFAVERLHDVFVCACLERGADVRHVVLGRAENDLGLVAMP